METIFKKAADPFETLHQLMAAHEKAYPDSRVSAVENGVYVSRQDERYHLTISSGDGKNPLRLDAGLYHEGAVALARHVCAMNPALRKVSFNDRPYIAVDPSRIADVTSRGDEMIFKLTDTDTALHVGYGDSHKAYIDSCLIGNKITLGRMGHQLVAPAPLSADEKEKLQRRHGAFKQI